MMKKLDEAVGKIMQSLDEAGLSANTLVIFTNDNGGERFSDHGGLSKMKGSLWEGGIRVPAFLRWPGKIKPGSTTTQLAITMDWTVTILSAANFKPHPTLAMDGIDIMPHLVNNTTRNKRRLYWRTTQREKQQAMIDKKWKYLKDEKGEYLFDISEDPGEKMNLRSSQPKKFERLKKLYRRWELTLLEPVPL